MVPTISKDTQAEAAIAEETEQTAKPKKLTISRTVRVKEVAEPQVEAVAPEVAIQEVPVEAPAHNDSSSDEEMVFHLKDLKKRSPEELLDLAISLGVENPSTLVKHDLVFVILKHLAEKRWRDDWRRRT
jgi:transcription termination factor Rho